MLFSSSDGNRTECSVPVFSCGTAVYAIGKYVTKFMVYDILYQFTRMDKKRKDVGLPTINEHIKKSYAAVK